MVTKEFRTWTQCKDHSQAMVDGAVDAKQSAEHKIRNLEAQKMEIQHDTNWHEQRILDMEKARAATTAGGLTLGVIVSFFTF